MNQIDALFERAVLFLFFHALIRNWTVDTLNVFTIYVPFFYLEKGLCSCYAVITVSKIS